MWALSRRAFNRLILWPIRRLSVSSWVSPGPLRPIPPFCLSRWVHPLISLVERWFNWASSTWSLPMCVVALDANISNISSVLSMTLTLSFSSRFLACDAESWWLTITSSAHEDSTKILISSNLPLLIKANKMKLKF